MNYEYKCITNNINILKESAKKSFQSSYSNQLCELVQELNDKKNKYDLIE